MKVHFGGSRRHSPLHLLLRMPHLTLLTCTSTSSNLDLHALQVALPRSHATALGTITFAIRCDQLHRWDLGSNHYITSSWYSGFHDPGVTVHFKRSLKCRALRKAYGITRPGLKKNARCCAKGVGGQHCSGATALALQGTAVGAMCGRAMHAGSL